MKHFGCLEIIDIFERNENALGMRSMALSKPPAFDAIEIEGVIVSIRPDFIVGGGGGRNRVGAAILRVAKAPDPAGGKRPETRLKRGELRREMARYWSPCSSFYWMPKNGGLVFPTENCASLAMSVLAKESGRPPDHAVAFEIFAGGASKSASFGHLLRRSPRFSKSRSGNSPQIGGPHSRNDDDKRRCHRRPFVTHYPLSY